MRGSPAFWTVVGALGLHVVCLGSVGLLPPGAASPSLTAPASVLLVIPIFLWEPWGRAIFVAWPLTFLAWTYPALRGPGRFPKRSFVLWALVLLLAMVWFVGSWRFGVEYQGSTFVWGCLLVTLLLASSVLCLGVACVGRPSQPKSLAAHWLLFAWAATYAFPYLGETP